MHIAKSARTGKVLGATLIALTLPIYSMAATSSSAVSGIDGSSVGGIDGSSVAGIDGSSVLGIDGSSVAGIDGSSVLGIDGSSVAGIDGSSVLGIDGSSVAGIDGSSTLLAGPVDSIDRVNGVFGSMGQTVMASQAMLSSIRVGDFVAVQGSVISSGWYYADNVSVSNQRYVPGATEVFITGMLSSVDRVNGTAQMGNLTIDYTASLGSNEAPSSAMWSFQGTRPLSGGKMISNRSLDAR